MKKVIIISLSIFLIYSCVYNIVDLEPVTNDSFKLKGIDISHHNRVRNWNSVSDNNDFVIMKATEGESWVDSKFNSYWKESNRQGTIRGAYHFFTPGVSGEKQFNNFKKTVKLKKGDLPPILDVELKECNIDEVNIWLKLAEEHYGVKPIIYTEYVFFKLILEDEVSDCKLWIYIDKDYGMKPSFNNYECVIWQYSHTGNVEGIDGPVDLDSVITDSVTFNNTLIN